MYSVPVPNFASHCLSSFATNSDPLSGTNVFPGFPGTALHLLVDKSSSHQLFQPDIASDNPCSRHLILVESETTFTWCHSILSSVPF